MAVMHFLKRIIKKVRFYLDLDNYFMSLSYLHSFNAENTISAHMVYKICCLRMLIFETCKIALIQFWNSQKSIMFGSHKSCPSLVYVKSSMIPCPQWFLQHSIHGQSTCPMVNLSVNIEFQYSRPSYKTSLLMNAPDDPVWFGQTS